MSRVRRFNLIGCLVGALWSLAGAESATPDARWGRLANEGFQNQIIKGTLFFSGQARDGSNPYGCTPSSNLSVYTVHPSDSSHLNWSASTLNRAAAIEQMCSAGINVVMMSSWGESYLGCSGAWVPWAPMQVSPWSHDELFDATAGRSVLIVPFLESHGHWQFYNDFPTSSDGGTSRGTVTQIIDLINRYLENASHPEWSSRWARVYDSNGDERYAVAIIHASSNRLGPSDHALYAAGFGAVAQEVFAATGVKVGFFLDALPPDTWAPGVFKPSPEATGTCLRQEPAALAIMCFIPEIWLGSSDDHVLLDWKRDFSRRWSLTGIPFLMDVSPGYDAHLVFPGSVRYGLNSQWTSALGQMVEDFGQDGVVFNSWNGYTEGMAAIRTQEYGNVYFNWLQGLLAPEVHIIADRSSVWVNAPVCITPTVALNPGTIATKSEWRLSGDSIVIPGGPEAISRSFDSVGSHDVWLAVTDSNHQTGVSNVITIEVTDIPTHSRVDFDRDGDVDQEDFGHLQACLSGAGIAQTDLNCRDALMDGDDDVDQADFVILRRCLSGANCPSDPLCGY